METKNLPNQENEFNFLNHLISLWQLESSGKVIEFIHIGLSIIEECQSVAYNRGDEQLGHQISLMYHSWDKLRFNDKVKIDPGLLNEEDRYSHCVYHMVLLIVMGNHLVEMLEGLGLGEQLTEIKPGFRTKEIAEEASRIQFVNDEIQVKFEDTVFCTETLAYEGSCLIKYRIN